MAGKSTFDPIVADEICAQVLLGVPLTDVCKKNGFPPVRTVYAWLDFSPEFKAAYSRARVYSSLVSESKIKEYMKLVVTGQIEPRAGKVLINAEQWLAAKRSPKDFGDKQTLEHTGADGGPLRHEVSLDAETLKAFILAVTHDCPTCRARAAEKLLEMETGDNAEG